MYYFQYKLLNINSNKRNSILYLLQTLIINFLE